MAVKSFQIAIGFLFVVAPLPVNGQVVPSAPLSPANGVVRAPFANVTSMHELSDGRVVMCDAMTNLLIVADLANGKFKNIAGARAMPLSAFPGDTTVIDLLGNGWLFLAGDKPIGMLSGSNPVVRASGGLIRGADTQGHILALRDSHTGHGDSTDVMLVNRVSGAIDTVTRLWMPPPAVSDPPPRVAFRTYEAAILSLDGWVAALRTNPYRVDWRTPEGRWIIGAPIVTPIVPLDDREKQANMVQRARGGTPESPEKIKDWPATVPPWVYAFLSPILSPDSKLLVRRTPTADHPEPRYDVIDRTGKLERQVVLAPGEFILGFGAKSVYIVISKPDGPQDVERHPWP